MRGAHVVAATLVAAAGMLKPQASLLLPALLVVLLTETRWRTWLKALLAGVAVGALALAPWWLQGHLLSALDGSLRPLTESTVSSQALNLWWIVGYAVQWTHEKAWPLARILFVDEFRTMAGWDVQWPSRLLLLAGTLANVVLLLRRPAQDRLRIPLAVLLQVHVFALAGTSVHENHTYLALMLAPLLLGSWAKAGRVLGASSALLFLNLFLFEGLGRGVLRDRLLWRLRLFAGLDLTVLVAAAHVAFVVALFLWVAQRERSGDAG
jgi:hypothetical protein